VKSYVDALSSNTKEEKVCHQRCIPDPENEERTSPKKNVDSNHGYYNKYKPVFHQRLISNPKNEVGVIPRKKIDSNHGYYNRYKTIFLGHYFHYKNFGHQARHCITRKSETPKLKDQIIKPYAPQKAGTNQKLNSFDPLSKFDLIFSLCYNNGHY